MSGERKKKKNQLPEKPIPEDVAEARKLINQLKYVFGAIPHTKSDSVEISPTIFYPDNGDSVYIGLKLKFRDEDSAKYFMKCVEEASER